jgi:hypothetical protein
MAWVTLMPRGQAFEQLKAGAAAPHARLLVEDVEPVGRALVARVEDEAVGLHDGGGPTYDELPQ